MRCRRVRLRVSSVPGIRAGDRGGEEFARLSAADFEESHVSGGETEFEELAHEAVEESIEGGLLLKILGHDVASIYKDRDKIEGEDPGDRKPHAGFGLPVCLHGDRMRRFAPVRSLKVKRSISFVASRDLDSCALADAGRWSGREILRYSSFRSEVTEGGTEKVGLTTFA